MKRAGIHPSRSAGYIRKRSGTPPPGVFMGPGILRSVADSFDYYITIAYSWEGTETGNFFPEESFGRDKSLLSYCQREPSAMAFELSVCI